MKHTIRDTRWFFWFCVVTVFVSRLFYPGREVSWLECIPDWGHAVEGGLAVLAYQGNKKAHIAFWVLGIYEGIMFAIFKGWL